jgi:hypothetical protein
MRAREFLRLLEEDASSSDPLYGLKVMIAGKIKDLPPTKETQDALTEIEDLLSNVGAGGRLGLINQTLSSIHDPSVTKAQKLLAKYILSVPMTREQRDDLFSRWRNDQLVNKDLLLQTGQHEIKDIILGYDENPAIKELTIDLAQVQAIGQGKGEFLLSVFSKSISKLQKGDLMIDGHQIEVKTYDVGGGRFYDQEVRTAQGYSASVENFRNTWADEIAYAFPSLAKSGLKLDDLILLSDHIEVKKKKKYWESVRQVFQNLFPGQDTSGIIDAMQVGSSGAAKQLYALTSVKYYQSVKKDDYGIIFINLSAAIPTFVFFKDPDELSDSGLRLHASTAYPVAAMDPKDAYPQIRIVPGGGGVTTAPSSPTASRSPAAAAAPAARKPKPAPVAAPVAAQPAPAATTPPSVPADTQQQP